MTPTEMHIDALMEKIEMLESKLAKTREALEFYAQSPIKEDNTEWSNSVEEFGKLMGDSLVSFTWNPMLDLGDRAREALKEIE